MTDGIRVEFRSADWAWLATYLAFLLVIGFWPRRRDADSYLIGSRSLSMPVFVATLVATSVVAAEFDAVAAKLERAPGVEYATWESVATG